MQHSSMAASLLVPCKPSRLGHLDKYQFWKNFVRYVEARNVYTYLFVLAFGDYLAFAVTK
jgi:hypothetical protein